MKPTLPIGQSASQRLEFKSVQSLSDPTRIASVVVAFLNSEGGDLWLGLAEDQGRAVGVETVPKDTEQRLRDQFVELIEPPISSEDVQFVRVEVGEIDLLLLRVRAGHRTPYAVNRSGRQFLIRIGDRIRPMDRRELELAFRQALGGPNPTSTARDAALARLRSARDEEVRPGLWLGVCWSPHATLECESENYRQQIEEVLTNPTISGGRPDGFVIPSRYWRPAWNPGGVAVSLPEDREVSLSVDGSLFVHLPPKRLKWGFLRYESERLLNSLLMTEFAASAFRVLHTLIARKLLHTPDPSMVICDASLRGASGSRLMVPPFDGIQRNELHYQRTDEDLTFESPIELSANEIREHPDRVAYLVTSRVFSAFGLGSDRVPSYRLTERRFVFND